MTAISIVFATYNGAATISRVLEGYSALPQTGDWNIVVVDNASTDRTPHMLRVFSAALPMTVLKAAMPGKNRALNLGLTAADGDLVVFTDDDSIPSPGFIDAWKAVAEASPRAALFGGRIEPVFEKEPPPWLLNDRRWSSMLLAGRDIADGATRWNEIYGPNMAVRRAVFSGGLRFDERIGPNSADPYYPMGSETDFLLRAEGRGMTGRFSRGPHVRHIIRARQLRPRYWARRADRSGKGRAFMLANHPVLSVRAEAELEHASSRTTLKDWFTTLSSRGAQQFKNVCSYHFLRDLLDGWSLYAGGLGRL